MFEQFKKLADAHNKCVNTYINVTLRKIYGDTLTCEQWFEAQQLIREQNFSDMAFAIVHMAHQNGFDNFKVSGGDNKIVY